MRIQDYHTLVAATWDQRKELWSEMLISAWQTRARGYLPIAARPVAGAAWGRKEGGGGRKKDHSHKM